MFNRFTRGAMVQDGQKSHGIIDSSPKPTLVEGACQDALDAHRACASLEPKAFDHRGNRNDHSFALYQSALLSRRVAVNRAFAASSVSFADTKAKCALLLALEDWFGSDDPAIGLMAVEIAREVHSLTASECACSHSHSPAISDPPFMLRNWFNRLNPFSNHSA